MKTIKIVAMLITACFSTAAFAQTDTEKQTTTERIEAKQLYDAFKEDKADPYKKVMRISGIVTFVGPDVYALPSVELSETEGGQSRVACVLPFKDYLKLRKVSKKDRVVMEGEVRGYSDKYDIVVVKQSKIIEVTKPKNSK